MKIQTPKHIYGTQLHDCEAYVLEESEIFLDYGSRKLST